MLIIDNIQKLCLLGGICLDNGLLDRVLTEKHACPRVSIRTGADYFYQEVNYELLAIHQNSHPAA
jgi:hypothetical protein